MNITHNIALSVGAKEQAAFRAAGIELQSGFVSFKIDERDTRWPSVQALASKFKAVDTASTSFAAAELNSASYLAVIPTWHNGYPAPTNDAGYLAATFDLTDYCKVCGIGKKQVAPFRLANAPVWGSKSIFQLNWIFDEYFVPPSVWEKIFAPIGIEAGPVVLDSTGEKIDSVVQLVISVVAELEITGPSEKCSCCGRVKFHPVSRGFFPAIRGEANGIFKSSQYFGSGASANKQVIASDSLYREIKYSRLKGIDFMACSNL